MTSIHPSIQKCTCDRVCILPAFCATSPDIRFLEFGLILKVTAGPPTLQRNKPMFTQIPYRSAAPFPHFRGNQRLWIVFFVWVDHLYVRGQCQGANIKGSPPWKKSTHHTTTPTGRKVWVKQTKPVIQGHHGRHSPPYLMLTREPVERLILSDRHSNIRTLHSDWGGCVDKIHTHTHQHTGVHTPQHTPFWFKLTTWKQLSKPPTYIPSFIPSFLHSFFPSDILSHPDWSKHPEAELHLWLVMT